MYYKVSALTKEQISALQKAGLTKVQLNQINSDIARLELKKPNVEIVVQNLVKDAKFRSKFLANPTSALKSLPVSPLMD